MKHLLEPTTCKSGTCKGHISPGHLVLNGKTGWMETASTLPDLFGRRNGPPGLSTGAVGHFWSAGSSNALDNTKQWNLGFGGGMARSRDKYSQMLWISQMFAAGQHASYYASIGAIAPSPKLDPESLGNETRFDLATAMPKLALEDTAICRQGNGCQTRPLARLLHREVPTYL